MVERDQPLLAIYSPDLVATQEEYLLALRAQGTLGQSRYADVAEASRELLASSRRRLQLWDVTEQQIADLERRGEPETTVALHSPIGGYVIDKNAYPGQYVGPDRELFTIADLSRVWVTADVYEMDLPRVRVGQPARVSLSYIPGRVFEARVEFVYPYLDPQSRTGKVRLGLSNPRGELKPDMFADVVLGTSGGEGLLVPEDAVLDTGERKVVLLALPGGHFQPREVTTGERADGQIQILDGVQEGDLVVSRAAFLVDSESKLGSALRDMAMPGHMH